MIPNPFQLAEKDHRSIGDDVYYNAFCFSSEPMSFTDAKTGAYLDINEAFLNLLGYAKEEVIGRTLWDFDLFVYAEDADDMLGILREKGFLYNYPVLIQAKDGQIINGCITTNIITVNGKQTRFTIMKDVTVYEKKLEHEKLYFQLFDNIPEVICIVDLEGRIKHRSSNNEAVFGFTAAEMIGKKEIEYYHPDDRQSIACELNKMTLNDTANFTKEFRYRCLDGSYKMVEVTGKNLHHNALINGILFTYRDISERKRAERIIVEERERYFTLINSIHDWIWIVDPDQFGMLAYNQSLSNYLKGKGVTVKKGMTPKDILGAEHALKFGNIYNMALREGAYSIEYLTEAKDKYLILSINPLVINGELVGISIFGEDITERKKVIQQLNETIANLEAIIENTEDFIYLLDKDYNLMFFNKAFKNYVLKCFMIELKSGMNIRSFFPAEYIDDWKMLFREIKKTGQKKIEMESRVILGTYYEFTFNPVYFQSKMQAIAVYVKDITEQKSFQKKIIRDNLSLEKMVEERTGALINTLNELELFACTVSHDLKSPLRAIEAYSRIVLEDYEKEIDDNAVVMIRNIQTISLNIIELIDKLLIYSTSSQFELKKEFVDLEDMIFCLFNELKTQSKNEIYLIKESNLPKAFADRLLIKQAIRNMIENAIKFSDPHKKSVISFGYTLENNETVYYIKDNGIGFDTNCADKLFNAFYQLDSDTRTGGHGIGLAIVNKLIKAHGGRVWMEGIAKIGAIVYFVLPTVEF